VDTDAVVALTSALVAVDTQNPPGGERPISDAVHDALSQWRPVWTEVEPEAGRLSLVAEIPHPDGPGRRPTLIVNGHLDVVPAIADAWSHDPFSPTVEDGRLYGRGSADMKGGIAAAVCALDALQRSGRAPGCNLVFHFVADEEVGGRLGTQVLLERGMITGDACLVPEPTSMQLCVAERGLLQGHVTVHGRPGHGSRPSEAVSAIEHAARLVTGLHGKEFGAGEHPLLGRPTCNIGTIEGGNGLNVIAERCRFGVDRRVLPGATLEGSEAELRERIASLGVEGLRYDFDLKVFGEASELGEDDPWLDQVRAAIVKATGEQPDVIGMSFTTDARFVRNGAGVPAVVCGPGNVEQTHAVDEWVGISRLEDATAAYAELYAAFSDPWPMGS
jgi:succinyl-diaminopimelate desuccinylase